MPAWSPTSPSISSLSADPKGIRPPDATPHGGVRPTAATICGKGRDGVPRRATVVSPGLLGRISHLGARVRVHPSWYLGMVAAILGGGLQDWTV